MNPFQLRKVRSGVQRQVIEMIEEGYTNKEIMQKLKISRQYLWQVQRIMMNRKPGDKKWT